MERGTIFFSRTKTGNLRTVEIHYGVEAALCLHRLARGEPATGHVFLSRIGKRQTDTRDFVVQGGNPLQSAHESLARTGIPDFSVRTGATIGRATPLWRERSYNGQICEPLRPLSVATRDDLDRSRVLMKMSEGIR